MTQPIMVYIFLRQKINKSLPTAIISLLLADNYTLKDILSQEFMQPYGTVDADWDGDVKHQKYIYQVLGYFLLVHLFFTAHAISLPFH